MTTAIYFFLMALILFIVPQLVLKAITKKAHFDRTIIYLVFAFCLPLIWLFLPKEVLTLREVNFIQHAVGGGVAVAFVAIYFIKNLQDMFPFMGNFLVQSVFVFALVSMLGVVNELFEFFLDFYDMGIFSADRYDTWYDFVANTIGAMALFFVYSLLSKIFRSH